jgi:hypothetical protein
MKRFLVMLVMFVFAAVLMAALAFASPPVLTASGNDQTAIATIGTTGMAPNALIATTDTKKNEESTTATALASYLRAGAGQNTLIMAKEANDTMKIYGKYDAARQTTLAGVIGMNASSMVHPAIYRDTGHHIIRLVVCALYLPAGDAETVLRL